MAVYLHHLPGSAVPPAAPRFRRWIWGLPFCLLTGCGLAFFLLPPEQQVRTNLWLWLCAVVFPFLFWAGLVSVRYLQYKNQQVWAQAWDQRREQVIAEETARGQRTLFILDAALQTASGTEAETLQTEATLISQASYLGPEAVRHSRLPMLTKEAPDAFIERILISLLSPLQTTLQALPSGQALSLLWDVESSVDDNVLKAAWQSAWQTLQLPVTPIVLAEKTLSVIDDWLDKALKTDTLLVISFQLHPRTLELSAEAAIALLLSSRVPNGLSPKATLHRPQAVELDFALRDVGYALNWGSAKPDTILHVWQSGLSAPQQQCLSKLPYELALPVKVGESLYNLDHSIGYAGCSASWLSIAAAALIIHNSPEHHLTFSAHPAEPDTLWATLLSPYLSPTSTSATDEETT